MEGQDLTPEGLLRQQTGVNDENLEQEVRSDMASEKFDKLDKTIEETYGGWNQFADMMVDDDGSEDDGGQAALEEQQQRSVETFEVAKRSWAKLTQTPEFSHLSFNDPLSLPIAQRLHAQNPNMGGAELARRTAETLTSYRGLGPVATQKGRQAYSQARHDRMAKLKSTDSKETYLSNMQEQRRLSRWGK